MYPWNVTIDDSSSMLVYKPFSDGASLGGGWMPWYSDYQANFVKKPGDNSAGQSLHITSFPGASVYLRFQGIGLYMYGSANCSYSVTLDGTTFSSLNASDGLLFNSGALEPGTHFVNLTAQPESDSNQQLAFDQALISNSIDENANGLVQEKIDNTQNRTLLQYNGDWESIWDHQIPSLTSPSNFSQTGDPLASVSMNFTGAIAVAINADRNWGHWTYNVSLDGVSSSYNASTYWLIGDALLFYQSNLDPGAAHQVELLNTGNADYYQMTLNYITLWKPNITDLATISSSTSIVTSSGLPTVVSTTPAPQPDSARSKVKVGDIVGPIVAVVAVLAIGIGIFLWRRRLRTRSPPAAEEASPDTVAPFPRNTRPDMWYKGIQADPHRHIHAAGVWKAQAERIFAYHVVSPASSEFAYRGFRRYPKFDSSECWVS